MIRETHIYITGVVQGVGFRAAVRKHALAHGIAGYARNLSDGRVEICAQGKEDQIRAFLHAIQLNPGVGAISGIETVQKPIREAYSSFEVR